MAEIRREVRTLEVAMRCKACGLGEMFSTGITLMSNPPQYPHKCRACGAEETLLRRYPYIANEPVPSGAPASDRPSAVGDDIAAIRAARIAGVTTSDEPYGWIVMWPTPGGGTSPIYKHGPAKPSHGCHLDALLELFPLYRTAGVPASDGGQQ